VIDWLTYIQNILQPPFVRPFDVVALGICLQCLYAIIRPLLPQVLVIITDGRSDDPTQTIVQANFMKLADIKIVCVGIVTRGDEGYIELRQIATDPEEVVRLQSDSFADLRTKQVPLLVASCSPAPPPGLYTKCFVLSPPYKWGIRPSCCLSVCPMPLWLKNGAFCRKLQLLHAKFSA